MNADIIAAQEMKQRKNAIQYCKQKNWNIWDDQFPVSKFRDNSGTVTGKDLQLVVCNVSQKKRLWAKG